MRRMLDAPIAEARLPEGITLRPFDIDTARECRDLMNRVYREAFGDPWAFDEWWQWVTTDADYSADLMFVAVSGDAVIGFCHCWTGAFIKDIVVDRAFRGRGIASALLTMALVACRDRLNAPFVDLKTDIDNVTAQSTYRRLGFEIVERVG
jgi:ribosomal protein S18 acetylase RimI-like enzyme